MSALKGVLVLCIIFYLANQATSLKCYFCTSGASEDCWKNPKKSEYEMTCSGSFANIYSDSAFANVKGSPSLSGLTKVSAAIGDEASIASRGLTDPECLKLTGFIAKEQGVLRICIIKGLTDDQIKAAGSAQGLESMTISRCDTDLCNSSSTFSISFLTLASSLLLIFSIKL